MKHQLKLLVAALALASHLAYADCNGKAELLATVSPKQASSLLRWLKAADKIAGTDTTEVYEADFDNDGESEYAVATTGGSARVNSVLFYKKTGATFREFEMPAPDENESGNWYSYFARSGPFYRLCGKTYFSIDPCGSTREPCRQTFLWRNHKTKPACEPDWTKYVRATLPKEHREAFAELAILLETCEKEIPSELRLWLLSDLALLSQKSSLGAECVKYAEAGIQSKEFASASEKVKHALKLNRSLCKDFVWDDKVTLRGLCETQKSLPPGLRKTVEVMFDFSYALDHESKTCASKAKFLESAVRYSPLHLCYHQLHDLRPLTLMPKLEELTIREEIHAHCNQSASEADWSVVGRLPLKTLVVCLDPYSKEETLKKISLKVTPKCTEECCTFKLN